MGGFISRIIRLILPGLVAQIIVTGRRGSSPQQTNYPIVFIALPNCRMISDGKVAAG